MLESCFQNSIKMENSDISLAKNLWKSFRENDLEKLNNLSMKKSAAFRKLKEIISANENRFNGILATEIKQLNNNCNNFNELFKTFSEKFGVYGFGDLQLKSFLS